MGALRELIDQVLWTLARFAVSLLPEEVKRDERVQPFSCVSAHLATAYLEALLAVTIFGLGMIRYVSEFSRGPGWEYLATQPTLTHGDFFGVGALAYVSYLLTPRAIIAVYFFGEAIVRALEATFSQRLLGVAPAWLAWRLARAAVRRGREARTAVLIGPSRKDEVVLPEASPSGMLEIYSVEQKPWTEVQVIEMDGEFYQLASRDLVPHGGFHAYRYLLHLLEERDVIRGAIERYQRPGQAHGAARPVAAG